MGLQPQILLCLLDININLLEFILKKGKYIYITYDSFIYRFSYTKEQ